MDIVLYYAPITCSLVPYVTLTEAKAEFTVKPINLKTQQQMSADYLRINPKHKVPLLTVDGQTLTENTAINLWIHRQFPAAKLYPADSWGELQALSLMSWCASGIHPYLTRLNAPAKVADAPGADAGVRTFAIAALNEAFKIADDKLKDREFFFDHFCAADAHFFWCFRRTSQFELDLSAFAACQAHFARMQTRPSVQKVLAFEKDTQAAFAAAA
jgi:glutathione S-transferase